MEKKSYPINHINILSLKTSLDLNSSDKFCSFVRTALGVMAQLLEIATLYDVGKHAEEVLGYFRSTVTLEPTTTVLCVQQVCGKYWFGTTNSCSMLQGFQYKFSSLY